MLKYRLPSGILMGLIIIGSIFIDGNVGKYLFLIFGVFLAYLGVFEYLTMLSNIKLPSYKKISALISALILALVVLETNYIYIAMIIVFAIVFAWFSFVLAENKPKAISKIAVSMSALPMLAVPLSFLALIYIMDNSGGVSGRIYIFFLLLITKLGDTGAYTVGTISSKILKGNNHKILPKISPKKSWEGTIGGMIISTVASIIFCYQYPKMIPNGMHTLTFAIIAGVLLFVGGFIGDLTESALKRGTGVKDSGNTIPGMGGALDVIDSLVLNAPLFYLFIYFAKLI